MVRAVDALGRRPIAVAEVAERSGLSVAAATDTLALAELQGLVERRIDGWVLGAAGRSGPRGRRA